VEENQEPTTAEDQDVEAHGATERTGSDELNRTGGEERSRTGGEERSRTGGEEPDFEGHALRERTGLERTGGESPELQAGTERPGEM